MMSLFWQLVCHLFGHSSEQPVPAVFFRSWDGMVEVGSLHCKRCGGMVGKYKRNLAQGVRNVKG